MMAGRRHATGCADALAPCHGGRSGGEATLGIGDYRELDLLGLHRRIHHVGVVES
jgi:hypothetical protein